jgi:hypothetical protein
LCDILAPGKKGVGVPPTPYPYSGGDTIIALTVPLPTT